MSSKYTSITSTLSDDIETLSIDVRQLPEDLATEKRARVISATADILIAYSIEKFSKPIFSVHSTAMPESTRSSSNFVFPPVFPSYVGISGPVPVPNISEIELTLATANAACNQLLPGHSKNKNDHLHPYMATGKPAATDILIDDNIQDILDSTVSIDKHDKVSPASVFPHFSTPKEEFVAPYQLF
jgi:hypothetical protein